jgi:hypothetical protein
MKHRFEKLFRAKAGRPRVNFTFVPFAFCARHSTGEIEIRTAHETMAARTTQLAILIDQLVTAPKAKLPVLAGNIFVLRYRTGVIGKLE